MTLELKPTRTQSERLVDLLLVLCAADLAAQIHASPGRTTTQKIFFWGEVTGGATHHGFIRHHFGPYSADLQADREWLARAGHLQHERFTPTERGSEIARHWRKLLEPSNREVFAALDASVRKRAHWSAERAKKEAYELNVRRGDHVTTLRELPQGESLQIVGRPFVIDEGQIEDLYVDLSMSSVEARGMRGRAASLEPRPA